MMQRNVDTITHTDIHIHRPTHTLTQAQTRTHTQTQTHTVHIHRHVNIQDACKQTDVCRCAQTHTQSTVTYMTTLVLLQSHVELLTNKSPGAVQPGFGGNNAFTTSQIFPKRWS